MDNMYGAKNFNRLHDQDTFIEKTKKEDEDRLFSKVDLQGNGLDKTMGMFDRINDHTTSIHSETFAEFNKLWKNQNASQILLNNASRYDLSKSEVLKEEINEDLEHLAAIDTHRSAKSRRKYIKKASEKYTSAAKRLQDYELNKKNKRTWKMVLNGESAILSIYEAEQSLIKAGGIFDEREKLRVSRNYAKCQDMLRRFYTDCLIKGGLSDKEKRELEKKLVKVKKEGMFSRYRIVKATLKSVPPTSELAAGNVMNKVQFLRYINRAYKENLPEDIEALGDALQSYHDAIAKSRDSEENGAIRKNVLELCEQILNDYPGRFKLKVAINIIREQVKQTTPGSEMKGSIQKDKSAFLSDLETLSGNDKANAELLKEDAFYDYGFMRDEDYNKMSSKNAGNSEEYKKWIYPSQNGLVGYLRCGNSSYINSYLRTGKVPDYIIEQSNNKEHSISVEEWKKGADKTIDYMWKATHSNVLQKKTRLTRMVNIDFFEHALKMDKNQVAVKNPYNVTADESEKIANAAKKLVGTTITDKSFISTGAKVDQPFRHLPVMMTLLCEKGQKCFVTDNKIESEVILPKNSKYVIVGIVSHAKDGKKIPVVNGDNLSQEIENYKGIEIIAKVVQNADEFYQEEFDVKNLKSKNNSNKSSSEKYFINKPEGKEIITKQNGFIMPKIKKLDLKKEKKIKRENNNKINLINEDAIFGSDYMTDKEFEDMFLFQEDFMNKYDYTRPKNQMAPDKNKKKTQNSNRNTINKQNDSFIDWNLEYQLASMMDDIYDNKSYNKPGQYTNQLTYGGRGLSGTGAMNKELQNYEKKSNRNEYIEHVDNTEEAEYAYQELYDDTSMFDILKADATVQSEVINEKGEIRTYTTIEDTPKMKLYLSSDLDYINARWEEIKKIDVDYPGFYLYMRRRVELIEKLNGYKEAHPKYVPGQILDGNKKAISDKQVETMGEKLYDNNAYYELTGVTFAGHQTTGLGCWSVSMASQLTYRGINMTQQEVRLYRPENLEANDLKEQVEFLGRDAMGSPVEVSEIMNNCFDNMATHVVEAESIYQGNSGMSAASLAEANVEYFRRSIIDGLVKHKSPVSFLFGNHFVTVVGIQGTRIKYLDSASMRKDGVRFGDLKDMCGSGYGQKLQLVWFEQLGKDVKSVAQNVSERSDAVYDGENLRIEGNKLEGNDRHIDKGMERCYNSKAVAFNDKKSRMEKQRALLNMDSKSVKGKKMLNRNDNYIINDKIYIPRQIRQ